VCAAIAKHWALGQLWGLTWERTDRLIDKYVCQKVTVGHLVAHTINNSIAFTGVVKGGQLGLKGKAIPHMKLPLFYKKESNPKLPSWYL
jgi:hypothetical protein